MPSAGHVELQSLSWLNGNKSDRPSFQVLRGGRPFRVFGLKSGLLFLEVRHKPGSGSSSGTSNAVVIGAVAGGAVGALIGGLIAESFKGTDQQDHCYDMCGEEELIEMACHRKRSFVCKYDEIRSISLDAPGALRRMIADRSLVGWISMNDAVLGRFSAQFRDPMDMAVAVEALPRRLGDRVRVNVELDERAKFVPKRR
jgi:hypothetical protein